MDTTEQSNKVSTEQGMRLLKSFVSTTPYAPGRRPFFKYRDLGLEGATGGRMRAYHNTSIFGDQWLKEARSAVLLVPSVVVRLEWNALVNPVHPDAAKLTISTPEKVVWDKRLFERFSTSG